MTGPMNSYIFFSPAESLSTVTSLNSPYFYSALSSIDARSLPASAAFTTIALLSLAAAAQILLILSSETPWTIKIGMAIMSMRMTTGGSNMA